MQQVSFEEQLIIENRSRNNKWKWQRHLRQVRGEDIYTEFCVWCNCQGQPELKGNARIFAEWLKTQGVELTEYQRRWIAENHFGWQFAWNEEKNEWESRKV